jgi:methyltransferase-like protein/ubiquinone/menaquinone biosynthesis C-methylase UbiE
MQLTNSTPYDEVDYPSYVYAQTHPDRLATIATLHGMKPAPVDDCRVLELGCGAGGNLIPMAFDLRDSKFVGVDLAGSAIAQGREMIAALSLNNISLQQVDVTTFPSELGQFDYLIAHGLFSWVPEAVRERILAICRAHLAPHGVAYISYNTYPGCRLREITRDIMRFHTKDAQSPAEKVGQSRAVIKWIAEAQEQEKSYATFLAEANANLKKRDDGSLYHDDLADINVPFYFHEFAQQASQHGLQFLSEADHFERAADSLKEEAVRQLEELGRENVVAREQYLDFLKGRSFRQTLLCHHEVALKYRVEPAILAQLLVRSGAQPVTSPPDLKESTVEEFRAKNGASATTDLPLAKAALFHLGRIYPRGIKLSDLLTEVRLLTETTASDDAETLAEITLRMYEVGVVELHTHEPAYVVAPSARPVSSPIAQYQLRSGNVVSTLVNESLRLEDDLARQLILLLDGKHDRDDLIQELTPMIDVEIKDELAAHLEEKLLELGKLGLLLL